MRGLHNRQKDVAGMLRRRLRKGKLAMLRNKRALSLRQGGIKKKAKA